MRCTVEYAGARRVEGVGLGARSCGRRTVTLIVAAVLVLFFLVSSVAEGDGFPPVEETTFEVVVD